MEGRAEGRGGEWMEVEEEVETGGGGRARVGCCGDVELRRLDGFDDNGRAGGAGVGARVFVALVGGAGVPLAVA